MKEDRYQTLTVREAIHTIRLIRATTSARMIRVDEFCAFVLHVKSWPKIAATNAPEAGESIELNKRTVR